MLNIAKEYANGPAGYSGISAGFLRGDSITLQRGVRDLNEDSGRSFIDSLTLTSINSSSNQPPVTVASANVEEGARLSCSQSTTHRIATTGPSVTVSKFVKMDLSLSGERTLVLRNAKDKPIVELMHRCCDSDEAEGIQVGTSKYDFCLDASSTHGRVLGDAWFAAGGDSSFSSDERYVVYVACDKQNSCGGDGGNGSSGSGTGGPSYFNDAADKDSTKPSKKGTKFEHTDDWGERYTDVHATVLCVMDTQTGAVHTIPMDDAEGRGVTVGQPAWQPASSKSSQARYILAYTQWANNTTEQDTKLGMIYCYQRPCSIRTVDITQWLAAKAAAAAVETSSSSSSSGSSNTVEKNEETPLEAWQQPIFTDITSTSLSLARSPRWCPSVSDNSAMLVCVGRTVAAPMYTHGGSFQLFSVRIDIPDMAEKISEAEIEAEAEAEAEAEEEVDGDHHAKHGAASKLQSLQRRRLAKKIAERKREEKRIAEEIGTGEDVHNAASKLQAIQRARQAKKANENSVSEKPTDENEKDNMPFPIAALPLPQISIGIVIDLVPLPPTPVVMPSLGNSQQASVPDTSFPGLFIDQLPKRPFVRMPNGNWALICTSIWGSRPSVIIVDLTTGTVRRLSPLLTALLESGNSESDATWNDLHHASCTILDVEMGADNNARVLFEASSPTVPPRTGLLLLDTEAPEKSLRVHMPCHARSQVIYGARSKATDQLPSQLQSMRWRVFTHVPCNSPRNVETGSSQVTFESILILPPKNTPSTSTSSSLSAAEAEVSFESPVKTTATMAITNITAVTADVSPTDAVQATLVLSPVVAEQVGDGVARSPAVPSTPRPSGSTPRSGKQLVVEAASPATAVLHGESTLGGTSEGIPLILVPHGGPHGATPTAWMPAYNYLSLSLNAAVLHVNYRGSLGFGQSSIDALPGYIGIHDTNDMMQALDEVIDAVNSSPTVMEGLRIDRTKLCVVGGSHGGFLTGHLTGQHPDTFVSAAMRNPVTNIPTMATITDIPDWCHIEAKGIGLGSATVTAGIVTTESVTHNIYKTGLGKEEKGVISTGPMVEPAPVIPYDFVKYCSNVLTDEDQVIMRACSPIAHVHRVKTPTLTCLGAKDRRVPHTQGIEWHRTISSMGVRCKLMIFPEDCHAIDLPCSEAEHFVAIRQWFAHDIAAVVESEKV